MLTPVGELPTHEVEKVTGELKLPTDSTTMSVEALNPWVAVIDDDEGLTAKSGAAATVTGTRMAGTPGMLTVTCVA